MPVPTPEQSQFIAETQLEILSRITTETSIDLVPTSGGLNEDFEIPPGTTVIAGETVHVVGYAPGEGDSRDSNQLRIRLWESFQVAHQLFNPFDEGDYRGISIFPVRMSVIDYDLAILLDKFWWLTIDGVVDATTPERSELEREGNVIKYTVQLQLTLNITQSSLVP